MLLRGYRLASGLTQQDLAERSGVSLRAIADMERGRTARPFRHSLHRLADALELRGPDRQQLERAASSATADVHLTSPRLGLGVASKAVLEFPMPELEGRSGSAK
jgi:transcriptional regulator with XRE-family HTH domain